MEILPEEKIPLITRSFDIYGSKRKAVAIIEIPKELGDVEGAIAQALMKINKNVKSVLVKESGREGAFRTRELRLVAGAPDTEVLHREAGCLFRLDPKTVYFSPRESSERDRLTAAVNEGEEVLVMFSGVCPLPIRIAKKHKRIRVTAVELNPEAHNYAIENIHLNRVGDRVLALQGDVREICPKLGRLYDRIAMPLPKGAFRFLDVAVPLLKDEGFLHMYHWADENDLFSEAKGHIRGAAEAGGKVAEFVNWVRVSQYSPRTWKVRIDARISPL
ncbi:MAG: class I SAM-dependent methyltransferase family protein [Candidatus Bathyarchaeota archaeon]|nr:MAG: class I SAM-dependent methyltransferase family protein [Candidatus Bathyarchaeota archaeon]